MPPISLAGSTFDYAGPSARQRWGAVLGIIVLHIPGVLLWPKRDTASVNATRSNETAITRREREIAAAFGERGPPQVVEEVMSDGRRRSRVGNKCANKESNGLVGARDVFRDGVKTRWGDC
jgi:hypothetical protein